MAYKWDTAHEWLIEYASKLNESQLFQEFTVLVQKLDGDTIQDLYQSEMDAQGYFDEAATAECPACGEAFSDRQPNEECPKCHDAVLEPAS